MRWLRTLGLLVIFLLVVMVQQGSCKGDRMNYTSIKDVPAARWAELAQKKIYFGHQSVGFNILDGIAEIVKNHKAIIFHILEGHESSLFNQSVFAHSRVGQNTKPETKIVQFQQIMDDDLGSKVDIAFLKFCYVDIRANSEVQRNLSQYEEMVTNISRKYPRLTLVHFTVPLKVSKPTWKTKLKNILGKDSWEFADNIKRNEFNKLLREKYQETGLLFDISRFESSRQTGERVVFSVNGEEYEMLNPDYTDDGGI